MYATSPMYVCYNAVKVVLFCACTLNVWLCACVRLCVYIYNLKACFGVYVRTLKVCFDYIRSAAPLLYRSKCCVWLRIRCREKFGHGFWVTKHACLGSTRGDTVLFIGFGRSFRTSPSSPFSPPFPLSSDLSYTPPSIRYIKYLFTRSSLIRNLLISKWP